ncbi:hypothetical protein DYB35_009816 [Aphanomyces astaci]|uniref:Uncharacterized protein n=1 Tax=Aphanomyces astaci TaxID=112090 RepID=A0A3R6ZFV1_APHAT|nr:hypothetical protein DYB35_009816 [Aphanomyces astaci]
MDHREIPIAALVDDRPSYRVDWWVRPSTNAMGKLFSKKSSWQWCQVALVGQTLTVFHHDKSLLSLATPSSTLARSSGGQSTYVLSGNGGVELLELHCPSATAIQKLVAAFGASQTSEHWTLPTSSSAVLDELVDVAKTIVEGANVSPKKRPVVPTPSTATVAQVQAHIRRLVAIYNDMSAVATSKEALYKAVLQLEADYMADQSTLSPLVALVLEAYPDLEYATTAFQVSITECPVCETSLHLKQTIDIHVGGKMLHCRYCHTVLSYETFLLADLVKNHLPTTVEFQVGLFSKSTHVLPMPGVPADGKVKTFMDTLWSVLTDFSTMGGDKCPRHVYADVMGPVAKVLYRTDLVQHMYRVLLLTSHVASHAEYWALPVVIQASIRRFDQFRHIAQNVVAVGSPVASIDIALVAQSVQVFETSLVLPRDHGSRSLNVRLAETAVLFHEAFFEPYAPSIGLNQALWLSTKVFVQSQKKRWDQAHVQVASRDSQFRGVQEVFPARRLRHVTALAHRPDEDDVAVAVLGAFEYDVRVGNATKLRRALVTDPSLLYDIPSIQKHTTKFSIFLKKK